MMRDHSLIEELMAIDALGGLDPADRELLANERSSHGVCEECARIEAEFAEAAGRLAFALDPIAVDDAVADAILPSPQETTAAGPGRVVDLAAAREHRALWRTLVSVAAAVVLVATIVILRSPGGEVAILRGAGPERLEITFSPGEPGVSLSGSGFTDLPAGQTYELWAIRGDTPIKAACFGTEDGGVDLDIDATIRTGDLMAVTVEPECASAPSTTPIITADTSNLT
jgi:anti-sigma-K factor RskA